MSKRANKLKKISTSLLEAAKAKSNELYILEKHDLGDNLLVFQIGQSKDDSVEVEIRADGTSHQEWTCECRDFMQENFCAHIYRALLQVDGTPLSEFTDPKEDQVPPTTYEENTRQADRINLDSFLRVTDLEQLHQFIKFYARKDRRFTHLFKARFASELDWHPSEEKYQHIFRSTCKNAQNQHGLFSNNGLQQIDEILHEFYREANHLFSLKNFTEVFSINDSILETLIPYFRRYREEETMLELNLQPAFLLLKKLLHAPAGIQLKQSIWKKCLFYLKENLMRFSTFEDFLHDVLYEAINERDKLHTLLAIIEDHFTQNNHSESQVAFQLKLLGELGEEKWKAYINKKVEEQDSRLISWVKLSLRSGQADMARFIAREWLNTNHQQVGKAFLQDSLLEAAKTLNRQEEVSYWAFERFKTSLNVKYFRQIDSSLLPEGVDALNRFIDALSQHPEKRHILGEVYQLSENWEELIRFLKTQSHLPLLMKFDEELFHQRPGETKMLYLQLVKDYLNTHLGNKAATLIEKVMTHLETVGQAETKKEIIHLLRTDFSDRHTLINLCEN